MKNVNCKIRTLQAMPYAQAKTRTYSVDGLVTDIILQSYATDVATIATDADGEQWLTVNGLYSATTRKHISAFMREFTQFDYSTAKKIYSDNVALNIATGEIKPIH